MTIVKPSSPDYVLNYVLDLPPVEGTGPTSSLCPLRSSPCSRTDAALRRGVGWRRRPALAAPQARGESRSRAKVAVTPAGT
eukprot:78141-Pyramimonas_sp.AAC.1